MSDSTKQPSMKDFQQAIRGAYNDVDASLTTNGFLVGKVGHKIVPTVATTTVANDTVVYSYYDGTTLLYQLTLIFTDSTYTTMISAERTA